MSVLRIRDLCVSIAGKQILNGIDLQVSSGEVHAIMGPNGSGKSTLSHALMGHPDYEIIRGSVTLDGEELLGLPTHVRAAKGLFLAPQYPVELPGVHLEPMLREALSARGADGFDSLAARLSAEAEWLYLDDYWLDAANAHSYPGHELLNLRGRWSITDQWSMTLRLNNALDRDYADRADFAFGTYRYFPGRDRALFVELSWQR